MRTLFFAALLLTPPSASGQGSVVADAARAMGGEDRIRSVQTLVLEGTGRNFNLGQNRSPNAPLPVFTVSEYRRSVDLATRRWREERLRTPTFPAGNMAPVRQILGLDGDVAFNIAPNGGATRLPPFVAQSRILEFSHHPITILQTAWAAGSEVRDETRKETHIARIRTANGDSLWLHVDRKTHLPSKVVSMGYNVNLGDVAFETEFGAYQEVDGLRLPTRLVSRVDGNVIADIQLTRSVVNGRAENLGASDSVRTADPSPPPNVTAEELAPGVWYLAGQTHHSVLVEFSDHLMLIETPQNEARTLAVIRKARELRPDKPLRYAVNTHHHFDHSGGVRAAVSEGLTLVTHARNARFFRDVAGRRHSLVQDALATSPKPLKLLSVGDRRTFSDRTRTVELYHIAGNPHAETLLMAYLPAERMLIEADVYTPPAPTATTAPAFPFAPNVLRNIERRKLRVERIVPIHGRVIPFADLRTAAQTASPAR